MSLFTHLSEPNIRNALQRLCPSFQTGILYASFFTGDPGIDVEQISGLITHPDRDPYHFPVQAITEMGSDTGWIVNWIGDIGHPRNQRMAEFTPA